MADIDPLEQLEQLIVDCRSQAMAAGQYSVEAREPVDAVCAEIEARIVTEVANKLTPLLVALKAQQEQQESRGTRVDLEAYVCALEEQAETANRQLRTIARIMRREAALWPQSETGGQVRRMLEGRATDIETTADSLSPFKAKPKLTVSDATRTETDESRSPDEPGNKLAVPSDGDSGTARVVVTRSDGARSQPRQKERDVEKRTSAAGSIPADSHPSSAVRDPLGRQSPDALNKEKA